MKVVFISGPYREDSYFDISRNIADAQETAAALARLGIGFFCPHAHSSHFEVIVPKRNQDWWYSLDLRIAEACDAVLFLPSWGRSNGSRLEYEFFSGRGKPIFFCKKVGIIPPNLIDWTLTC